MTDVVKRLQGLSPERRKLLELRLNAQREQAAGPELRARPRTGGAAPLSFAQARLWVLDRMDPGGAAYNMSHPLRIRGALDVGALARALDALRARHETLRTTIAERDGEPVQVIHPPVPVDLPLDDLSFLSQEDRETEVGRRVDQDANTGFDLVAGPLLRASLLRLSDDEHVLLLTMHHIVSDGWSMGIISRELGEAYAALREGRAPRLDPLPVQYADFAAWQREHLRGEELNRLTTFWRTALEGAPRALELPTDRPRPPAESHRGRTLRTHVDPATAARLREVALAEGATLFNVLCAAFRTVLARHAGQSDVVLGTPVANRGRRELEGLAGFFVDTVPLRARVDLAERFGEMVRREQTVALAAFAHQALPFDRIVDALKLPRDPSRNPVFQAMVTLQNARMEPVELGGVEITPVVPDYQTAKFDLTLDHYEEDDGSLRIELEWATDLFEEGTVRLLAGHHRALLAAAAADPSRVVGELPLADAVELRAAAALGRGGAVTPAAETVHGLFLRQAEMTPDEPALAWSGGTLSYGELRDRAAAVAARLRAHGVGPEARVGAVVRHGPAAVAALLGTMMAGGAWLPIDPDLPAERIAWMLEDAGARVVLADAGDLDRLPSTGVVILPLEKAEDAPADAADAMDGIAIDPANAAYVLYTSGSTGAPKGVVVTHGAAAVHLAAARAAYRLRADDRVLAFAALVFDPSLEQILAPLACGASVALRDPEPWGPAELAGKVAALGVTVLNPPTAYWARLAAEPEAAAEVKARARLVIAGGEAMPADAAREWSRLPGGAALLNAYGPTEGVVTATVLFVPAEADDEPWAAAVPVGRPLAGRDVYVVDAALRPAGLTVPGEICLGGAALARGYLGRAALTAERFVPDPFSRTPGARMYRTGDRARWRADGALEFLGRMDAQAKLRGYRVEPGEVEAALRALPPVRDCAVAIRDDDGERRLVAYVVAVDGAEVDARALREALGRSLPAYMVPTAFVALDALPLTPNGKVDRRALPAPGAQAVHAGEHAAPRTPAEEVLAGIWQRVLRVDDVGIDDDFFALGGHSLLAAQVVSRVRQAFGVELPLRAVFEAPTVRRLAARLEGAEGGAESLPPVTPVDRSGALPLSFAQERMWFLERLEPGAGLYNMPVSLRLSGALDVEALRRALEAVVHRHEALRTRIHETAGEPLQTVAAQEPFHLPMLDAAGLDEARKQVEDEAWRPFDLEHGLGLRAVLVRIDADDHLLGLTIHHAVADGWALGIILREVSASYAAYVDGGEPDLSPVPLQYGDFAAWQRTHLTPARLTEQAAWWRERLEGAPRVLELPVDRPRAARQGHRGGTIGVRVPAELVRRVKQVARGEGATPFMALLAGFQALLGRMAGETDVVVGTPVAGRVRAETEGVVGLFMNTLALRGDLSGDPTFRALLARVREATLGAFARQELPFEKLVELLGVERSLSHAPLFQAIFSLNTQDTGGLELPGIAADYVPVGLRAARFDLALSLEDAPDGGLQGLVEYAADLFDAATAERIVARWMALLDAVTAAPDAPLSAAAALSPDERALLTGAWADGGPVSASSETVDRAFARWVSATPDAPALAWSGGEMTFAALDQAADAVARRLRAAGVAAEMPVGVLTRHGPEAVIALLGVIKAGGAYLPLDPASPAERTAWMLRDAGARVALADTALASIVPAGIDILPLENQWDKKDSGEVDSSVFSSPAPWDKKDNGRDDSSSGSSDVSWDKRDNDRVDAIDPQQAAYVLFTSGSTGIPKRVIVPHGALVEHLAGAAAAYGFTAADRVLAFAAPTFDPWIEQVLAPLLAGASVAVRDPELWSPAELADKVAKLRITFVNPPTAYWERLVEDGAALDAVKRHARLVLTGGEAMPPAAARRWVADESGAGLMNGYGPTEAVVTATVFFVPRGYAASGSVPIGRPLPGHRAYVLDAGLLPAGIGVAGELCLGGAALARGYPASGAGTAERFVPDPFSSTPGARMYRTGDRARWLADGTLEFLGRLDRQVKVRGFRVEPGEVEAALGAVDGVAAAVVEPRTAPAGDVRLAAWIVAAPDALVDAEAVRAALRQRLPEHLVPAEVSVVESFPLTPNGKVDRRALPDPAWRAADTAHHEPPRTPTEEVLAGAWREVLGVVRVGRHDSFFALGGHSLLATRVVARIRRATGVELPLRDLFEALTLEALAHRVDAVRGMDEGMPQEPMARARSAAPRASFAQERLWFVQRLSPGATTFNMPMALRLRGELNVDALHRALSEIVSRHEVLRTTFARGDEGPVQVIHPPAPVALPLTDLSDAEDADARLREMMDRDASTPFELERGPLLRLQLIRVQPDEHVLLLGMHHVVSDGWSMERLHLELAALYAAFVAGRPSPLSPLPAQYADYAAWQRDWLRGEVLERQAAFWKERVAGAPVLELPADRPRPGTPELRGTVHERMIAAEVGERLDAVAREAGATAFMALLAGFCALLYRWSGERDLVIGTAVAGRPRAELEELIGFFVNVLALRVDVSGDPTYRELLARVRETALEAYAHQDLPFEKVIEAVGAERVVGRHPVTTVQFGAHHQAEPPAVPGLSMEPVEGGESGAARADLTVGVTIAPDGLRCSLEYATDLFDAETIARQAERFAALLGGAAETPDVPLSALFARVDAEEIQRTVHEWNRTDAPFPNLPIHRVVAGQAARTPDTVALVHGGERMTYAQMDAAANRLARRLISRGVRPETRVGVVAERGMGIVIAVLGVLKAGGAFVPLDPAYPEARLRGLIEDAEVRIAVAPSSESAEGVPLEGIEVISLDAAELASESPEDQAVEVDAENLAYVIYTSGSTGRPKGVLVPHRGVPNLATWWGRRLGVTAESRVLQLASWGFDAAVAESFAALAAGGTLVLAGDDDRAAGPPLLDLLRRERVTLATLPPSVLAVVSPDNLPELRTVLSAGEALGEGVAARWAEGRALHNGYGPTEATVCASIGRWAPEDGPPTIGRALENVRAYVLDAAMRPAAVGAPGELYVGGIGVARGYHRRPGLTAAAFVPDSFSGEQGARLYRTGDRVRWLPDGRLRFLGRVDDQVKVRGFRIEPGEIAALLEEMDEVHHAVVVARGEGEARRLVAYVVAEPGAAIESDALRARLKARLPAHMVPAAFVAMDALPLTPNGKVDRARLPEPAGAVASAPPQGELERTVAAAWCQVLGVERVGVNDSFFEIGGHSLLLARLQETLEGALGRPVALVDLFRHPTVRSFAASLGAANGAGSSTAAGVDGATATPTAQTNAAKRGEDRGAARRGAVTRRR
ncbi:MAG TPA: amino acid adenylation domain-containing protein [Longimicrobium sp.]|nr:amino acid adenylation domain-containing protein [Longimicrobium sp.]